MPEQPQPKEAQLQESQLDLTSEAREAAHRLATKQFIKLTREPLVALIAGHLDKDDLSMRAKVAKFLDSDLGEGLVAALLSLGVLAIPANHPEVKELASQLRIKAIADVGDVVVDVLMAPLRQVLCDFLKGDPLPALPVATQNIGVPDFQPVQQVQHIHG